MPKLAARWQSRTRTGAWINGRLLLNVGVYFRPKEKLQRSSVYSKTKNKKQTNKKKMASFSSLEVVGSSSLNSSGGFGALWGRSGVPLVLPRLRQECLRIKQTNTIKKIKKQKDPGGINELHSFISPSVRRPARDERKVTKSTMRASGGLHKRQSVQLWW